MKTKVHPMRRNPRHALVAIVINLCMVSQVLTPAFAQAPGGGEDQDSYTFSDNNPSLGAAAVATGRSNAVKVKTAPVSATGSFDTSVTIDLPPGRGLTPSLSLSYSSDAFRSDSPVGAGWSLSVPSISRSTIKGFPRVIVEGGEHIYDPAGLYTSPSGELVLADASVVQPSGASGTMYVPERETAPVRYEYRPTQDRWIEHLPSGIKRYYGASRSNADPARVRNELGTHRWLLVQERDALGNTIDYSYHNIAEQGRPSLKSLQRLPIIHEIAWGANDQASLPHLFRVETSLMNYQGDIDMLDGHVKLSNAIEQIAVYGPSHEGGGGGEELYWTYSLGLTPSVDTGRLLLRSVTRTGADPGEDPVVHSFKYSNNVDSGIRFSAREQVPNAPSGVYQVTDAPDYISLLAQYRTGEDAMSPPFRSGGYKFLDNDADGDLDILYHGVGFGSQQAELRGAKSFSASPDATGLHSEFTQMGANTGYEPRMLFRDFVDVDGDRDLDGISFPMEIVYATSTGQLNHQKTYYVPEQFALPICEDSAARASVTGWGNFNKFPWGCPDPLPPISQFFSGALDDLDVPPLFPGFDLQNPEFPVRFPDTIGALSGIDFRTLGYSVVNDVDLALAMSYPAGSFRLLSQDDQDILDDVTITLPPAGTAGAILYERWNNVQGRSVDTIPLASTPSETQEFTVFDSPRDVGDNYGVRMRGWLTPPTSGDYRFWVAGDDNVALYLSSGEDPAGKVRIAYHTDYTGPEQWGKFTSQRSGSIHLEEDRWYYIEALMKEASGKDSLSVAWAKPGQSTSTPSELVPGRYLAPYEEPATAPTLPPVLGSTPGILYEKWTDIPGRSIDNIPVDTDPEYTTVRQSFDALRNIRDNYGVRMRGWVTPPTTGDYKFWVAGDDNVALYLSTDQQPANKSRIAYHNDYTGAEEWNKFATQQSASVHLIQGQWYYIEALMKEQSGQDTLSVGWLRPGQSGNSPSEIIPGSYLAPYTEMAQSIASAPPVGSAGKILYEKWTGVSGRLVTQIPVNSTPSVTESRNLFSAITNSGDNYGVRMRGWIGAPATGAYSFWVSGDDNVALYLSTDDQPGNKVQIAYHNDYTGAQEWNKFTTQRSVPVQLVKDRWYYIEALLKESGGSDHLAVGWLKPGQTGNVPSEVIPGQYLAPYAIAPAPLFAPAGDLSGLYDRFNEYGPLLQVPDWQSNTGIRLVDVTDQAVRNLFLSRMSQERARMPVFADDLDPDSLIDRLSAITPNNGLVTPLGDVDLTNAKNFVCNEVCNNPGLAEFCIRGMGGSFGASWAQQLGTVVDHADTPRLSDRGLMGLAQHIDGFALTNPPTFASSPGVLPGFPECSEGPTLPPVCAGMVLACGHPDYCEDSGVSALGGFTMADVSLYDKQYPIPQTQLMGIHGWPRQIRQTAELVRNCDGGPANVHLEMLRDFQAPILDVNADGRADIVLLKNSTQRGQATSFIPYVFLNEGGSFTRDSASSVTHSAFTESLNKILFQGDATSCFEGMIRDGVTNPDLVPECSGFVSSSILVNFNTFFVDLNADGLPDFISAYPPAEHLGGKCRPGHGVHINRGYEFVEGCNGRPLFYDEEGVVECIASTSDLPELFPTENDPPDGPGPAEGPLELLRNRSRACGFNDIEFNDELPMSAMRIADLNADGREDMIFSAKFENLALVQRVFINTGRDFDEVYSPLPSDVGNVALRSGNVDFEIVNLDRTRFVDFDNDGLVDILYATECGNEADLNPLPGHHLCGNTMEWRRNLGVIPDLLERVDSNSGSWTEVDYLAATSLEATRLGHVERQGDMPNAKIIAATIRSAAGPEDDSWGNFGPGAVQTISLSYDNYVREQDSTRGLGFENVTAEFVDRSPDGTPFDSVVTTTSYDTRRRVVMTNGQSSRVVYPLRGAVTEVFTATGDATATQSYAYEVAPLGNNAVRVRTVATTMEQCEGNACLTTGSRDSDLDSLGYAQLSESGNVSGGSIRQDVDRVVTESEYDHRVGLWKLGLVGESDVFGYRENINGSSDSEALLKSVGVTYDSLGRPSVVTKQLGAGDAGCAGSAEVSSVDFTYTSYSLPETITEQGVRTVTYTYDPARIYPATREIVAVNLDDDQVALTDQLVHDLRFGSEIRFTDFNDSTYRTELDSRGRKLEEWGPSGTLLSRTVYNEATASRPSYEVTTVRTTSSRDFEIRLYRDGAGQELAALEQIPDEQQQFTRKARNIFDSAGRLIGAFKPRRATSMSDVVVQSGEDPAVYLYDGFDRPTFVREPGRQPTTYEYGVRGSGLRRSEVIATNPRGFVSRTLSNAAGDTVQFERYDGQGGLVARTALIRDGLGHVVRVIDGDDKERNLEYDLGGRMVRANLTHQVGSAGAPVERCFDADGNVELARSPQGRELETWRDNLGRAELVELRQGPQTTTVSLAYDDAASNALGRLHQVTDASGVFEYGYDTRGRRTVVDYEMSGDVAGALPANVGTNYVVVDQFGRGGQLLSRELNGLGMAPTRVVYQHNDKGQVKVVTGFDATYPSGRNLVSDVSYDELDRAENVRFGNGVDATWSYDATTDYLISVTYSDGPSPSDIFAEVRYPIDEYDQNGNAKLELRYDDNGSTPMVSKRHTYDALDRLQSTTTTYRAGLGTSGTETFSYSSSGNVLSGPAGAYQYENASNADAVTDVSGGDFNRTLSYDLDGILTAEHRVDTSDPGVVRDVAVKADPTGCFAEVESTTAVDGDEVEHTTTQNVCDRNGQRVVRDTLDEVSGSRTRVVYLPGGVEVRPDENGADGMLVQRLALGGSNVAEFAWSLTTGEWIGDEAGYSHTDLRGSVLAKTSLDGPAQTFAAEADYGPWGQTAELGGAAIPRYQFTGKDPDPGVGYYHYGPRVYDPSLGRWLQPDPLALLAPGEISLNQLNLYAYAANNPVMLIDLMGLEGEEKSWFERATDFALQVATRTAGFAYGAYVGFTPGGAVLDGVRPTTHPITQTREFQEGKGAGLALAGAAEGVAGAAVAVGSVTVGGAAAPATAGASLAVSAEGVIVAAAMAADAQTKVAAGVHAVKMADRQPSVLEEKATAGESPQPRVKAKERRAAEQAKSKAAKHGDPDYVEPKSESYAKHKARELEKAEGKDARRAAHNEKRAGEPDRTKEQLDEDYGR